MNLSEKLADAKAEVERLERQMLSATCIEAGHDWVSIGGANAGCCRDCGCSVPVFQCKRCGDCDYGDNEYAPDVISNCASRDDIDWLRDKNGNEYMIDLYGNTVYRDYQEQMGY
ncbi:hypothetical protein EVB91_192 [Rhizobium phage RHph_I1_18]|nr:hypothetical protein EVB91_192 [Rhizobium phage RHph_I1_18]